MPEEKISASQEENEREVPIEATADAKVPEEETKADAKVLEEVEENLKKQKAKKMQEVIDTTRIHIAMYNVWEVAHMMRNWDFKGIAKVLWDDSLDYYVFKGCEEPKLLPEALDLGSKDLDYLLATVLYIWDHPVVEDDTKFFEFYEELPEAIAKKAKPGSVEEHIANVLQYKKCSSLVITLQELLGVTESRYGFDEEIDDGYEDSNPDETSERPVFTLG